MQTVKEQSNVRLKLIDPLGKKIEGLKYEVKKDGQVIAKGKTDAQGKIKPFNSELGAMIDLYVARFDSGEMKKIKTLIPWSEVFSIKLLSSKVKESAELVKHDGDAGEYKRKTYDVKPGDRLESIAQKHGTTVGTLAKLNEISSAEEISPGQTLKLPPEDSEGDAPAPAPPAAEVASPSAAPTPDPKAYESGSPEGNKQESSNSSDEPVAKRAAATDETTDVAESSSTSVEKKEGGAPVPTEKTEDRGENGTPKTTVDMVCDKTACIKLGDKGALVEEINIRLTGFGGTISPPQPLNEFTAQTETAVKQFQRDYMGVAEAGKVCGPVLRALDEFREKYPVTLANMMCNCGKCDGFGNGYTDSSQAKMYKDEKKKTGYAGIEYPGIHRSVLWAFRAALFYTQDKDKTLEYGFFKVSSGYRCWFQNAGYRNGVVKDDPKSTINHMGNALDLQFKKGQATTRCEGKDVDELREKIFVTRLGAQMGWGKTNKLSLEPASAGATSWVHVDVREFGDTYKADRYYATKQTYADGDDLVEMARRDERLKLVNCGGIPPKKEPATSDRLAIASMNISKNGIKFIKSWEKCGLSPYEDSEGYCTIGWGHLIAKNKCSDLAAGKNNIYEKYKDGITQEEADNQFDKDIQKTVELVKKAVIAPVYQQEFDALVSLLFNLGGFGKCPKLLSKLNTKDYSGCCDEFADITNRGVSGLEKRRKSEMKMFRNGFYVFSH